MISCRTINFYFPVCLTCRRFLTMKPGYNIFIKEHKSEPIPYKPRHHFLLLCQFFYKKIQSECSGLNNIVIKIQPQAFSSKQDNGTFIAQRQLYIRDNARKKQEINLSLPCHPVNYHLSPVRSSMNSPLFGTSLLCPLQHSADSFPKPRGLPGEMLF